jgi:hypothetical protein
MSWKSKAALRREYRANDQGRKNLAELFAIRQFLRFGFRAESFRASEEAINAIHLTPQGSEKLERLKALGLDENIRSTSGKFGIFLTFFHQDLFVDVDKTDVAPLRELVHRNALSGALRYPWLFDHMLYDRAYDQFAEMPEHISRAETERLLHDTPPGVFQIGTLLVGPLGLVESEQTRLFRPRNDILLSHCSDATCNHAHVAMISVGGGLLSKITSEVTKTLAGDPSDYQGFVAELQVGYSWYDDYSLKNLPWLLGNAFSEREIRILLADVIARGQARIRSRFPVGGAATTKLKGSAADLAGRLSKPEALQLLMLANDETIVAALDALVSRGEIVIPPSETRIAMASAEMYSWNQLHCECSQLGVRVVSREGHQPLARLRRLILQVYTSASDRKQLAWMLGRASAVDGIQDDALGREVERFILEKSPSSVIRELIFPSHEKLTGALAHVRALHFALPKDRSEDRQLTSRILWKLGFPRTHFDSKLEVFYEKVNEFQDAASNTQTRVEQWKENVRAAGVNCFAATEEILDLSLAFSAWLLLSDHYAEQHVFDLRRARGLVARELSGVISTEGGPLLLSAGGDNTLFPLVAGFLALAQKSSDLLQHATKYEKQEVLMAHYSHDSTLQIFPYRHDRFLFDACRAELDKVINLLQSSSSSLQRSSVIAVRNGVIHTKEKFPTKSEIDTCCDTLRETVQALEDTGLVPTVFTTVRVHDDAFRRQEVTSVNYGDRHLKWSPSPALHVIKTLPSLRAPQVIVPSFHLPNTDEPLRFSAEEDSEYRDMWRNYPRRKPPTREDEAELEEKTEPQPASVASSDLREGQPAQDAAS